MLRTLTVLLSLTTLTIFSSCSPAYVLRAGWEEAGILLGRKNIDKLVEDPETDSALREKLALVRNARLFAKDELTLKPGGSYTQYSKIDRDVLVWVLSASKKTSLSPYTWWFPVVGRVPYKGFFDKEDGIDAARELEEDGLDIFLRPSAAFSTLGWFNDPLLSTVVAFDNNALVDTVIHEIVHNTIWINNNAIFNESLANFVGGVGAIGYFEKTLGADDPLTVEARAVWNDQKVYARFLADTAKELETIYGLQAENPEITDEEILTKRKVIFEQAKKTWKNYHQDLQTKRYKNIGLRLNNAVILAQQVYLSDLSVFEKLYQACNNSLPCFIKEMKGLEDKLNESEEDLFQMVLAHSQSLGSTSENPETADSSAVNNQAPQAKSAKRSYQK